MSMHPNRCPHCEEFVLIDSVKIRYMGGIYDGLEREVQVLTDKGRVDPNTVIDVTLKKLEGNVTMYESEDRSFMYVAPPSLLEFQGKPDVKDDA